MSDGRENRLGETCPKCGAFPQPEWIPVNGVRWAQYRDAMLFSGTSTSVNPDDYKQDHEHLWFKCPCGYSWERPTRDAGSAEQQGIVVPKGYDMVPDDNAPACPVGYRIVKAGKP